MDTDASPVPHRHTPHTDPHPHKYANRNGNAYTHSHPHTITHCDGDCDTHIHELCDSYCGNALCDQYPDSVPSLEEGRWSNRNSLPVGSD